MARRKRKGREEQPPESNRGRPDARGIFVIFEPEEEQEQQPPEQQRRPAEDEPLARDDGD